MAELIGQAVLELVTDQTGLDSGLEQAKGKAENFGKNMAAAGAALTLFGAPFALLGQQAVNTGDDLLAMSEKVGISVERLSGWKLGLEQSNTSLDALQVGMKTFSTKAVGDMDEALLALADQFASMPDGADKAKLAVENFGRSGMELIPFLNQGSKGILAMEKDAKSLGLVLSTKAAIAADQFNDSLTRLTGSVTGFFNKIIETKALDQLATFANNTADIVAKLVSAHPEMTMFIGAIGLAAAAIGPLLVAAGALAIAIGALSAPILAVFGVAGGIAIAIAALVAFTSEHDKVRVVISEAWANIKLSVGVILDAMKVSLSTFTAFLTGDWRTLSTNITTIWNALWETIKGVMMAPIEAIKAKVKGLTDGVTGFFGDMYDAVVGNSYVPDMISGIEAEFAKLPKVMETPAETATGKVKTSFSSMFTAISEKAGEWSSSLGGVFDAIGGRVGSIANRVQQGIQTAASIGQRFASGDFVGGTLEAVTAAINIFKNIGQGRRTANTWVQESENAFWEAWGQILPSDEASVLSQLPKDQAAAIGRSLKQMNDSFLSEARTFASQGGAHRTVIDQSLANTQPHVTRVLDALRSAVTAGGGIPQFKEGTDFVPQTGLAMVHQGEGVITADDNSSIKALLQAILDVLKRGGKVFLDGREVGRTLVPVFYDMTRNEGVQLIGEPG